MFKALTPILAILLAIGLIFTHIRPTFSSIKAMQDETADYKDAISKANELQALIAEKLAERDQLDAFSLERLALMLPEEADELGVIMSLDALAREKELTLSGIEIATGEAAEVEEPEVEELDEEGLPIVVEDEGLVPSHVDVSFTLEGSYEDFRSFIASVEESLVLLEIMDVKFSGAVEDKVSYAMTVRAFALESQK